MNEPALEGVARGWTPQASVANRSEPLRQAKDAALFESSEAALESSSAFGRRRAGPLRPDLSLGGNGAVMAGDRLIGPEWQRQPFIEFFTQRFLHHGKAKITDERKRSLSLSPNPRQKRRTRCP